MALLRAILRANLYAETPPQGAEMANSDRQSLLKIADARFRPRATLGCTTASAAIALAFLLHGMHREGFLCLAAGGVVMISRVYIGTHYASDVLGGVLTAFHAASLVRMAFREGTAMDRMIRGIL